MLVAGVASGLISTVNAPCFRGLVDEPGGRIDHGGRADGDEDVAVGGARRLRDDVGFERFAEPDHAGTNQPAAMRTLRRQLRERQRCRRATASATSRSPASSSLPRSIRAAESRVLARSPATLVQAVDVLGDQLEVRRSAGSNPRARDARRSARTRRSASAATHTIPTPGSDRGRTLRRSRAFPAGSSSTARRTPRKVGTPLAAETPAPVRTVMRASGVKTIERALDSATQSTASCWSQHLSCCAARNRMPSADSARPRRCGCRRALRHRSRCAFSFFSAATMLRDPDTLTVLSASPCTTNCGMRFHVLGERRRAGAGERHQRRPRLRILRSQAPTCRSRPSNGPIR